MGRGKRHPQTNALPRVLAVTRLEALDRGLAVDALHDHRALVRQYGIQSELSFSARVWGDLVVPSRERGETGETTASRLEAILSQIEYFGQDNEATQVDISVFLTDREGTDDVRMPYRLVVVAGRSEVGYPALTVVFPNET